MEKAGHYDSNVPGNIEYIEELLAATPLDITRIYKLLQYSERAADKYLMRPEE
jgi:hypothetical protein